MSTTGSALLDDLIAKRDRIHADWSEPKVSAPAPTPLVRHFNVVPYRPREPEPVPSTPPKKPKSVEERIAEAETFRGKIPDRRVKDIKYFIKQSAQDLGEIPPPEVKYYPGPTVIKIQCVVAEHFSIDPDNILSRGRAAYLLRPRDVAMYLAKTLTPRSLNDIGQRFGGRDHVTILHAARRVEKLIAESWWAAMEIEMLSRILAP